MLKVDVIIIWPKHIDYPLGRYNLKRFQSYFNTVTIALTDMAQREDYSEFLINSLPFCSFKRIPRAQGNEDWRDSATNALLEKGTSDWVLFLELDFLVRDERLFEIAFSELNEFSALTYIEGERIHPAFALIKRDIVNKTTRNFAAQPPAFDHFGLFFKQVGRHTSLVDLEDIGLHKDEDYYHLGGLTQNYHAKPYYKPNQFLTYNYLSLQLPVPHHPEFKRRMEEIIEKEHFEASESDEIIERFFVLK